MYLVLAVFWVGVAIYWALDPSWSSYYPWPTYGALAFAALSAVEAFIGWRKGRPDA